MENDGQWARESLDPGYRQNGDDADDCDDDGNDNDDDDNNDDNDDADDDDGAITDNDVADTVMLTFIPSCWDARTNLKMYWVQCLNHVTF